MSSLKALERKAKTVFTLDTPHSICLPQWPVIPEEDQRNILELLCSLLKSQRNASEVVPSALYTLEGLQITEHAIVSRILVGFNAVTRRLEQMAKPSTRDTLPQHLHHQHTLNDVEVSQLQSQLAAVFVSRLDSQPSALHAHLPMLCALTSVILFQLEKGSEDRLCQVLGMSRIGVIALPFNVPNVTNILNLIKERHLGCVSLPYWLVNSKSAWTPTKIRAVETTAPPTLRKEKQKVDNTL